mmetsp:Transcript_16313/g.40610  ORF Transcript_16313/g.40610 Transcript_16313/m.40610 type:complete len:253 (+) Transcript_16313:293-1051(+)
MRRRSTPTYSLALVGTRARWPALARPGCWGHCTSSSHCCPRKDARCAGTGGMVRGCDSVTAMDSSRRQRCTLRAACSLPGAGAASPISSAAGALRLAQSTESRDTLAREAVEPMRCCVHSLTNTLVACCTPAWSRCAVPWMYTRSSSAMACRTTSGLLASNATRQAKPSPVTASRSRTRKLGTPLRWPGVVAWPWCAPLRSATSSSTRLSQLTMQKKSWYTAQAPAGSVSAGSAVMRPCSSDPTPSFGRKDL